MRRDANYVTSPLSPAPENAGPAMAAPTGPLTLPAVVEELLSEMAAAVRDGAPSTGGGAGGSAGGTGFGGPGPLGRSPPSQLACSPSFSQSVFVPNGSPPDLCARVIVSGPQTQDLRGLDAVAVPLFL